MREGLEALGYKVKKPKDLQNPIFYQSVALGDVDYWTIFKLKPGQDVMWINVPPIMPKESQMEAKDRMTVSGE